MATEDQPHFRVLKVGSCPSLSGRSTLGFQIACTAESDVLLRLVANSGSGFYSQEWTRFASILDLLPAGKPLTFSCLQPLFEGRSVNTGGFLLAVLKSLGVIRPMADDSRQHQLGDLAAFGAEIEALMASPISLGENARPDGGKTNGKAKRRAMELAK